MIKQFQSISAKPISALGWANSKRAFKLLKLRRNGTLCPLFINRKQVISIGKWLPAEDHPTKGYAHRPGLTCHSPAHCATSFYNW